MPLDIDEMASEANKVMKGMSCTMVDRAGQHQDKQTIVRKIGVLRIIGFNTCNATISCVDYYSRNNIMILFCYIESISFFTS